MTLVPDSLTPGLIWPAIPRPVDAVMFAVLFQMEQSQWWPAERVRAHQFGQIQSLIEHAVEQVPAYRDRLRPVAGLPPEEIEAAWSEVPILRRTELQEAGAAFNANQVPPTHGARHEVTTTGSTGTPVHVQKTAVTQLFRQAVTLRGHIWHRRDFASKVAMLRRYRANPPDRKVSWAGGYTTGPAVQREIQGPIDEHLNWLAREDPQYFLTYPTMAMALAERAIERGMRFSSLQQVSTVAELVTPPFRARLRELWGVPIVDVYSAHEADDIALQCPGHDHYLVQAECVLLEVLDENDKPCVPGEVGRVVITVLHNFATPLIRYELGDYAELGESCPTGRGLPVLRQIMGRSRNMVVTPKGDRLWVRFNGSELATIGPLRQIQFRQKVPHEIELLAVARQPLTVEQEEHLRDFATSALGYPFALTIHYVDEIPRTPGGKYEDVHSELSAVCPGGGPV